MYQGEPVLEGRLYPRENLIESKKRKIKAIEEEYVLSPTKSVLIVDDSITCLKIMAKMMNIMGHRFSY